MPDALPDLRLVQLANARISEMAAKHRVTYPSAMKCLTTPAYARFPPNTTSGSGTLTTTEPSASWTWHAACTTTSPTLPSTTG